MRYPQHAPTELGVLAATPLAPQEPRDQAAVSLMRHAVPRIRAERPLEQAAAPHNVVVYLGEVLSGGRLHAVPLSKCLTNIMMYLTRAKRCLTMSLCMQARRSQKVLTEAGGTCSNPARSTRASRPSCSISHAPCGASHPCWKACQTCCSASQRRRVLRRGTVRRHASCGTAMRKPHS